MRELYGALYDEITKPGHRWMRPGAKELSFQTPMVGNRYDGQRACRLMWIGRALNGWEACRFGMGREAFADQAADEMRNRDRFVWLWRGDAAKKWPYNYRQSAFWRTCKFVHDRMLPEDERWFEDIAWANLYPIAPAKSGNPSGKLCDAQRVLCGELLKKQMEALRPTHIVFVTDWDWFADFNSAGGEPLFPGVRRNAIPGPIVGSGRIGEGVALITRRPEGRPEQPFVEAICAAFGAI